MSRAARLLDLLQLLRGHRRPVTGAALAAQLGGGISLRTLYRDIATLQAQGAVIDGSPGLGYVLQPGFTLPPLMLTADEADAVLLGLRWVAERATGADAPLAAAAHQSLAKIAAVLPPERRRDLEYSGLMVGPAGAASSPLMLNRADEAPIRNAIRHGQKLRIAYRNAEGADSTRVVWPIGIGFFDQVRVVVAWCEQRDALRHFRTDRIAQIEPLAERQGRPRAELLRAWQAQEGILPGR